MIRSINQNDGTVFDFCEYYYNVENLPDQEFIESIESTKNGIALYACERCGDPVDFVAVLSVEYEEVE
jgi:hypothetical protein